MNRRRDLKIGDMVDFRSPFFGATSEKLRPGIIVEIEMLEHCDYPRPESSCLVLWANGRTTNEWYSILERHDSIPSFR